MNSRFVIRFTLAVSLACGSIASAVDVVSCEDESSKKWVVKGKIVSMSRDEVVVIQTDRRKDTIPTHVIVAIQWEGQPAVMEVIPAAVRKGDFKQVDEIVNKKIKDEDIKNGSIKQEIAYGRAWAAAKRAMEGKKLDELKRAILNLRNFVKSHPNSWRHYQAIELTSDLFLKMVPLEERPDDAITAYVRAAWELEKLSEAPWKEYKDRIFRRNVKMQREACLALKEWSKDDSKYHRYARAGYKHNGRPLLWGWALLSKRAQKYVRKEDKQRLASLFFEARYELSLSYYVEGMLKKGREGQRLFQNGYDSIDILYRLYKKEIDADEKQHKRFNELFIKFQTRLGKPGGGLKQLDR